MRGLFLFLVWITLSACVSPVPPDGTAHSPDILLIGEQHDVPAHQEVHRRIVAELARPGLLAALALEMSEHGASTAGLPRQADEAAVRAALRWDDAAWPWRAYAPAVMTAVASGVPVIGANLPRAQLREAMSNAGLDALLPAPALDAQRQAIRAGHCGLLPEHQIAPMARAQIARDRAMAEAIARAAVPGKTVVLLTGAAHADPVLGVPHHIPAALRVESVPLAMPADEPSLTRNYCADLRRAMPGPRTPVP